MSVSEFPELRKARRARVRPLVDQHAISEIFQSIQGEGTLAGAPSTFIRYAHCNLTCSWCDAAYTWKGKVESTLMTTADVVDTVAHRHIVITGGEPTYAEGFPALVSEIKSRFRHSHITVETNGTEYPRDVDPYGLVDLWSVSPKLGSSGQAAHLRPQVVQHYVDIRPASQLKFVIDSQQDLEEVEAFLKELVITQPDYPVYLQPNGLCHNAVVAVGDEKKLKTTITDGSAQNWFDAKDGQRVELETPYGQRYRWLIEAVLASDLPSHYNMRVLPQCHKLAFGNKRGF